MSSLKDRIAAQRKAIADKNASFDRAYKWLVGKSIVRILPGVKDPETFDKDVGAHYIKNPATGALIAVVGDAEVCYGKICPVRQAISELIQQANERHDQSLAEAAKGWLAKRNHVCNMEILGGVDAANKGKVVRVEFSDNLFDDVLSAIQTMMDADPAWTMKDGIALVVERTGTTQKDTRYAVSLFPKELPAPTQAVLDQRMDLDSYVDGKFGMSVTKGLTALSTFLGRDVTQTAIGSALKESVSSLPSNAATTTATDNVTDADFDDILGGDNVPDATVTTASTPAATAADPVEDADFTDILADLENLS